MAVNKDNYRMTVVISKEEHERLKRVAEATDQSLSRLTRVLLKEKLEVMEKEVL